MTNWMTAAGLAFIAAGLATLISFRAVIFGRGARRATRAGVSSRRRSKAPAYAEAYPQAQPETVPRRSREPEAAMFPSTEFELPDPADLEPIAPPQELPDLHELHELPELPELPVGETWAGRRRRRAEVLGDEPADLDDEADGLASIGLADAEPLPDESLGYEDHEPGEDPDHVPDRVDPEYDDDIGYEDPSVDRGWAAKAPAEQPPAVDPWAIRDVDRSDRGYGDRVEGWVRPSYRDLDEENPPAGDYWTPVPDALYNDPEPSARGYGWPVPVERLPPVPDYEPATGFDLTPVQAAEPTLVAAWRGDEEARRIRLPRSWRNREDGGVRPERSRPRPRPRPTERSEPGYVSRHSAGPHG